MERGIAVGIAGVAHFYGEFFFDGEIEEGAGGVPGAGDCFVGDAVTGDGEEAGLAADFVNGAAQGFFFVGRGSRETRKIEDWEVGHAGTVCQRVARVKNIGWVRRELGREVPW